jgi:hypothetical protein
MGTACMTHVGDLVLCFESPDDAQKLDERRTEIIHSEKLAAVICDHRIPLFFLEACESAKTEKSPETSVAAALLNEGVASVVAMSHSVLVETARRFVKPFYTAIVMGSRVGDAMLKGRLALKNDTRRGKVFGAGPLHLEDWFVPVLFQEMDDVQLFQQIPSEHIQETDRKERDARMGKLPPTPPYSFVGRSRELLRLERLLHERNYAVICGQGGEGKTVVGRSHLEGLKLKDMQGYLKHHLEIAGIKEQLFSDEATVPSIKAQAGFYERQITSHEVL